MILHVKTNAWYIAALFAIGLFIRVFVFSSYLSKDQNFWQVDSMTYHSVAQGVAAGKGISHPSGAPNFYRLPGYPLFVGACYKIFGPNPRAVLWIQVFLGALIPIFIFLLSLAAFPTHVRIARAAGVLAAINLGLVLYSGFFMTETLFILFFLAFLFFFFLRNDNPRYLAVAGFLLGCASLIRPVGHFLIVLMLAITFFTAVGRHAKLRNGVLLFVSWLIPVSIWLARNYVLLGHLFFHTLPGGHFLYLSAARVVMYTKPCTYQQARMIVRSEVTQLIRKQERAEHRRLSEIEKCNIHEQLARSYFMAHPVYALRVWVTDMFRTAFSLYSAELLYLDSGRKVIDYFAADRTFSDMFTRYLFPETENVGLRYLILFEILAYLAVLLGILLGFWHAMTRPGLAHERPMWYTFLSIIALFITLALAGGYARMRLPVEPLMIILACYGFLVHRGHHPQKK